MFELRDPDNNVVQTFGGVPKRMPIPDIGNVHGVRPGWTGHGGWSFIEVSPPEQPLNELKIILIKRVDSDAEQIRLKYITSGTGMSMTYREKLEQAEEVIAKGQAAIDALDSQTQIVTYPTLAASVGIEAASLWDCAQTVIAKYQAWATLSHEIEKRRLGGKKAISEAADNASAQAAYDAVSWAGL